VANKATTHLRLDFVAGQRLRDPAGFFKQVCGNMLECGDCFIGLRWAPRQREDSAPSLWCTYQAIDHGLTRHTTGANHDRAEIVWIIPKQRETVADAIRVYRLRIGYGHSRCSVVK